MPLNDYQEAVIDSRKKYRQQTLPRTMRRLFTEYVGMLVAIDRSTSDGKLSPTRATALKNTIREEMDKLSAKLTNTLNRGVLTSAAVAAQGHANGSKAVAGMSAADIKVAFDNVPAEALALMQKRRDAGIAANFRTLINRNIEKAARGVDRYLSSAIGRGITYDRAGKELAALFTRGDKRLLQILDRVGPIGGSVRGIIGTGTFDEVQEVRGLLFDARRIVITEMNTSYYEADRYAAAQSDVVDLVRWTLSARHEGLPSSPDICTVYANTSAHGYGPGLYHPASAPPKPHPFCGCSLSHILLPVERWGQKRPLPNPTQLTDQDVKQQLQRLSHSGSRSITDNFAARQREMAEGLYRATAVAN
jgi:hypothetical protein